MSGSRCSVSLHGVFTYRMALPAILVAALAASVPAAPTLTTLASFSSPHGVSPESGVIADAHGNLYGTTYEGGLDRQGTIFRLDAETNTLTTVAFFNGANGINPASGLIADANGNLYGTTAHGGANDDGTVFRFDSVTNTLTALASFNGANGATPTANLIADADGNLFGTTAYGGADNYGTIFRLDAKTNELTTLAAFNGANEAHPLAGLIADADGNLYGTTSDRGPGGQGTVFRLETGTNTLLTLVSFNGANGGYPRADLIADSVGNLYGSTVNGGANGDGIVFRLDAGTNTLSTLATFDYFTNGSQPNSRLLFDTIGNLFGVTALGGGANGRGTVFRLDAGTSNLTTLVMFNGAMEAVSSPALSQMPMGTSTGRPPKVDLHRLTRARSFAFRMPALSLFPNQSS